jgi:methylthioribose-1-phosphate isomerase
VHLSIGSGAEITIEQRDGDEVRCHGGSCMTPPAIPVWNPAFDVTPATLVTAIVTERGVFAPPELARGLGG